ncbi:MAG: DapH/DapD/GlmU-related protein [Alphaproteobacteria bacterium]
MTYIHPLAQVSYQPEPSPILGRAVRQQRAAVIGRDTRIGPYAIVYAGAVIGNLCLIGHLSVIREGCIVGDRCLIGSGCFVNYEATIGDDVRIIEGTHVAGMARIGGGTFIGPRVSMSNMRTIDVDHQVFVPADARAPVIGERVMIGTGASIVAGVRIGDRAVIGQGAVVCRDVPPGGYVRGEPARNPAERRAADLERQLDAAETMVAAAARPTVWSEP